MTLFHLWDLPGDVLAAPESASGLDRCNHLSLSLSLSLLSLSLSLSLSSISFRSEGPGVSGCVGARNVETSDATIQIWSRQNSTCQNLQFRR